MTPAGWPESAATVERWVRATLASSAQGVEGLERMRITAALDGDDLDLTVDATGVSLLLTAQARDDQARGAASSADPEPPVAARRPGVARSLRLVAHPVLIDGFAVRIDGELHDLPIEWIVYDRERTAGRAETRMTLAARDDLSGSRGAFAASMASADLGALAERVGRAALGPEGVHVNDVGLDIRPDGAEGITIRARGRVRWRLVSASARASARLSFSPDGLVTIRDLRVRSANPLVAIALRAVRGRIRAQIGRTIDLNETAAPGSPRIHALKVRAGDELSVEFRWS